MRTVHIHVEPASLAWLGELNDRLSAFSEVVEKPVHLLHLVRDLLPGAASFDFESVGTGRAGDYRIVLKQREPLLRLMAALRAFDGERHGVDKPRT
jgi:hypothetical protein